MSFVYFRNNITASDNVEITTANRAFKYGDGLFETICILNNNALFIDLHFIRLLAGLNALEIQIPINYTSSFFKQIIHTLCEKNAFINARCRITIWRKEGGNYLPINHEPELLIEVFERDSDTFILNASGLRLGVYSKITKNNSLISPFKTTNSLVYVLAAKFAHEHNFDDVVLLNNKGNICDCVSANVFIFKDNVLCTPAVSEGGIDGVMKKVILLLCKQHRIKTQETIITHADIENADEVFTTNVIQGIKWISSFKEKKYENKVSKQILSLLNEAIGNNSLVSA